MPGQTVHFCLVVLQLSWPFSSLHVSHVCTLATCHSQVSREIQSRDSFDLHTSWVFFTLSYTQFLHDSHQNTGYLIAKIQANLAQNKVNTWLNKFNLTLRKWVDCFLHNFGNKGFFSNWLPFVSYFRLLEYSPKWWLAAGVGQ